MSDWDASDNEETAAPIKPAVKSTSNTPPVIIPRKSRFAGEDEEESEGDDWDASDSDKKKVVAPTVVAPPKKKGTLKQRLAAKEAERARAIEAGDIDPEEELTPQERRRLEKQMELDADLANASDLLGDTTISSKPDASVGSLADAKPKTKADLEAFSARLYSEIYSKHSSNPLFAYFVEFHAKTLCETLKDSEVRKTASGLNALANIKQQEQRDKASGKKKTPAKGKPQLGGSKNISQADTRAYTDALDDGDDDDFM
ncbi:translation initiation factor eif3 subunit [Phaffia rhodozyma]|uniref:Eukaryotic translation initiation factor 3 30 kDa subunit n=1 Tax=Phaffia rhodozyma TaxID=264483 RepID=A0A0F7SL80_PHARH|nr:translation initiation factor eif3 subunit [Phaffia rhodozyma]